MAALAGGYPSVDAVAVWTVLAVIGLLAVAGAMAAWAAGRPATRTSVSRATCVPCSRPRFDWPCACGHTSDACTKRSDGTCDG